MWPNNGFVNNGQFPNNFNLDDYPPSPFGGSSGPSAAGQYFSQQQPAHPNMMQYEDSNGESFNDFQPEVGLYNEGAFMQTQFFNPNVQFSPPPFNIPQAIIPNPPRPTQINARAAELKLQLLKGREARGATPTPPVGLPGLAAKQTTNAGGSDSSSLRGSPRTPMAATENREQDLNALISQYSSESKLATNATVKQVKNNSDSNKPTLQRLPPGSLTSAKSQEPSLGSPTKVTKPVTNGKMASNNMNTTFGSRHASNGSLSEISEGEIFDEPDAKRPMPPTEPKQGQEPTVPVQPVEQVKRKSREEPMPKLYNRAPHEESLLNGAVPSNTKSQAPRDHDDHREEFEHRQEKRPYQPDYRHKRKPYPESDHRTHPRRDVRDEEHRRSESNTEQKREDQPPREQKPPTLELLLPHDEDLREWLEITGYHNAPYRDKILNRRRAIAALDAQRDRLLAEMEAEEQGGLRPSGTAKAPTPAMLPPPIPKKVGGPSELSLTSTNAAQDAPRDRVVSSKRSFSDVQDPRIGGSSGKMARTDGHSQRIKEEEDLDYRRPRSSGMDLSRRPSFDRRDDRDTPRGRHEDSRIHEDSRVRSRGSSRERDSSSGRRAYESRPPARTRSDDKEDFRDREENDRDPRPFVVRGAYRGRAFDPNYRGRGRGRGRGDFQGHFESKNETSFGSRVANGKPYKDPKGFDRGGQGDTRYFIVKSFNEENVLRCIEDSVWTTQIQNGIIFKDAFETCRNVILVFSINKSRAFQGYARMESLPGSVEVPQWQRAINWESAGAFKVKWLVICSTRFHFIGHLKNSLNENQAVFIGKDGQEIEEDCGAGLIELIGREADSTLYDGGYAQSTPSGGWVDWGE